MGVIDEIKQRIDIVDLISRYVPLKKAGRTYKACCPFHEERTPSFVVFPDTGTWRCFGACGSGGDAFTFLAKKENVDFRDALQILAKEVGVELEPQSSDQPDRTRHLLHDINAAAALFFQETLRSHPGANAARAYIQRRQIDPDTVALFQLGYAPDSWDSLRNHLSQKGYSLELQVEAGLLKQSGEHNRTYDAFRNRVMIPIRDRQQRVIGFGGRVLDDSQPKYLNTAETPLFLKSQIIYGLDLAYRAIRQLDTVVIVEGYMDVIAAHQHGFANVVACMGTSLTAEQLRQLQRYSHNFILALDADTAGQQATMRGLNQARQALSRVRKPTVTAGGIQIEERLGADLRIAALPQGQDPDDLIRRDADAWGRLTSEAQPLVDFYFDLVAKQQDLSSARGKGLAVAELAPLIAELNDNIERQHYIQQLSRLVQVDEQTIQGRVQAAARTFLARQSRSHRSHPRPEQSGEPPAAAPVSAGPAVRGRASVRGGQTDPLLTRPEEPLGSAIAATHHEEYLLAILLLEPELLIRLAHAMDRLDLTSLRSEDWQHVEHQEIFRSLKQFITGDEPWDLQAFQETVDTHLHERLARLMVVGTRFPDRPLPELEEALLKKLIQLRLERLKAEVTALAFMHIEAKASGDRSAQEYYSAAVNRFTRDRNHLERALSRLTRVVL